MAMAALAGEIDDCANAYDPGTGRHRNFFGIGHPGRSASAQTLAEHHQETFQASIT